MTEIAKKVEGAPPPEVEEMEEKSTFTLTPSI